jgi:hypothetical protein
MIACGSVGLRGIPPVEQSIERLLGSAFLDGDVARRLLREPGPTALSFGLSPAEAALIGDLRAVDLVAFARALSARLYGMANRGAKLPLVSGS